MGCQLTIFDTMCIRCNKFLAEYGNHCDSCASDEAYAMFQYCEKHNFIDYSGAVNKIGRENVDKNFIDEGWFQ